MTNDQIMTIEKQSQEGGQDRVKEFERRRDYFAWCEKVAWCWNVFPALIGLGVTLVISIILPGCKPESGNSVVVYAAQDQVYAEPILEEFTRQTGIKVRPLFDSEAVKTVGLAQRLIQERRRPQCDVFWGNEEMRTRQLAGQEVFRETNGWAAFGYRSRRIVINTNRVTLSQAPRSLAELTNETWREKWRWPIPCLAPRRRISWPCGNCGARAIG